MGAELCDLVCLQKVAIDQTKTFQAKIKRLEKINCGSSKIVFLHRALVIIFQIGIIII